MTSSVARSNPLVESFDLRARAKKRQILHSYVRRNENLKEEKDIMFVT